MNGLGVETMKEFLIVIERAEGNYSGYAPDLPGCVATGRSVEEVERLMREGIDIYIRCLIEDYLPIPEPTSLARPYSVAA
jgi:predicted RNase H-like HicB family nuclease